jgi:hypothetical protein
MCPTKIARSGSGFRERLAGGFSGCRGEQIGKLSIVVVRAKLEPSNESDPGFRDDNEDPQTRNADDIKVIQARTQGSFFFRVILTSLETYCIHLVPLDAKAARLQIHP